LGILAVQPLLVARVSAQDWDHGTRAVAAVSRASRETLKLIFEQRGRYENRAGNGFGKDADLATGLYRTRVGLAYTPVKWLKLSGTMQDARAPWYGSGAPATVRDPAELHEAYVEIRSREFGMTAGRMMLNYGEGRLIGTPQWGNVSRSYDHARMYRRTPRAQIEALVLSPVKVRMGEFNRPVPGDRIWGTYNAFPNFYKKNLLEAYVLRREQNRPGGFAGGSGKDGTDRLRLNTFGVRLAGPLAGGVKYSFESAIQGGKIGPADQRASARFIGLSRRWNLGRRTLDLSAEYKYASGTANPSDSRRSGTFDQLYASNHDKFGHQDLFGWRNIHNARSLATLGVTKSFALNVLYNSHWLANLKDGVYNGSGKLIVRSAAGTAGRHVGQEADLFGTYKRGHFTFGAGYGYFFPGQFIRRTTPGIGPTYIYVFHTYSL
jgi:hypothetical protein